MFRARLIFGQA